MSIARTPSLLPLPLVATLVVLGTSPLWNAKLGLYPYVMVEIAIWMTFALGYNLLLGGAGLPSFGHGAFFGVGAYATGLAVTRLGAGLWTALACGALAGAIAGAIVGAFVSHRRGIYYALLTIAFGQVFWFVSIKWHSVTGGEDGLLNIRRPPVDLGFARLSLDANESLLYLALGVLAVVALFLWRLAYSPYGRVLGAVKQNEVRAAFVGHRVWQYKWSAFVISCTIAALAGSLFALAQQSAYPNVMSLHQSGFVVMMVLIGGGLVSFWGPLIGVAFFLLARDLLGAYTETWLLWYGLLFMAVVLFKPEGIAGLWRAGLARVRRAFVHAVPATPARRNESAS